MDLASLLTSVTIGLHTMSVHVPAHDYQNNANFGLHVETQDGIAFGGYHNTIRRTSLYAGKRFVFASLPNAAITIGALSGYQRKVTPKPCEREGYEGCDHKEGFTRGAIGLLVAPSYTLPLGTAPDAVKAEFVFMPGLVHGSTSVMHLVLKKTF